jgi:curved DNA-binding protein CbpA
MPPIDPYKVLQVLPTAEPEVLNAAFRALAMKYHPDREPGQHAARRMAELNAAWELVRDPESREAFDRSRRRAAAAPGTTWQGTAPAPDGEGAGTRLNFGRYAGWRLIDLARHDTEYLVWLAGHASGKPYRQEITDLLLERGIAAA